MTTTTEARTMPAPIADGFIMPDFGPRQGAPAGTGPTGAAAPAEAYAGSVPAHAGPRKIAFICSKGNLDMAYPALIMGNAALSEGAEVHIFFTFWGLDMINQKTNQNLKFTISGNTAMHMPALGNIRPGLEHFSVPQQMGGLPGMGAFATRYFKKEMADLDIPDVPEFLDLMAAQGAHMYACRLTFDMMKLLEADLHPAVEGVISAADFIVISEGAQVIFV
ncbi:DsrE/DsrF/DrsH-like family protein [Raineyella sp.]|uniref:DsrE/DsrF/DrsH-like family protein n=1 Tax=Raineyella sp. TaxID=1911550 RepID=UPI002B20FA06|nr:DsrE/DsrF/DrsH-like family protein [Raineyella sp.]MEA5153312.1 DsrE/DsrF/DrsH-like family protein [Raineyella sp.]